MSSRQERNDFIGTVIDDSLLDSAIDWIAHNMTPEQVFDEEALTQWARENDMRTPSETASHYSPEDVFDQHTLRDWSEANGYVEEQ
jgi:hypothetical protein